MCNIEKICFANIKDHLPSITRIIIILNKYYSLDDIMSESTDTARPKKRFYY